MVHGGRGQGQILKCGLWSSWIDEWKALEPQWVPRGPWTQAIRYKPPTASDPRTQVSSEFCGNTCDGPTSQLPNSRPKVGTHLRCDCPKSSPYAQQCCFPDEFFSCTPSSPLHCQLWSHLAFLWKSACVPIWELFCNLAVLSLPPRGPSEGPCGSWTVSSHSSVETHTEQFHNVGLNYIMGDHGNTCRPQLCGPSYVFPKALPFSGSSSPSNSGLWEPEHFLSAKEGHSALNWRDQKATVMRTDFISRRTCGIAVKSKGVRDSYEKALPFFSEGNVQVSLPYVAKDLLPSLELITNFPLPPMCWEIAALCSILLHVSNQRQDLGCAG